MSLSKQLLLFISLIFVVIFSVNIYLSIGNIKSYLEVESEIHVQDTATSLGLSLSPHMADEHDPIIRTMMNAIFDMGYYKEMRLVNVDGEDLVKLTNPEKIQGVPEWLIKLMPMKTATAVSEINSGWNISGTIYITANPGYGYLKLYQQAKSTLKYSLFIFFGAIALLILALRFTLQSLKDIEKQANEISSGNFTTISKMPWTLEVKNVAQSMNSMSKKIGDMISRLNTKLESLSDSLKRDPLTSLLNQATFDVSLKQALSTGKPGYAAFIKFDDLADIAKDKGNKTVNNLLIDFAEVLKATEQSGTQAFRLYGSEFGLLLPGFDSKTILAFAESLKQNITVLGQQYEIEDLVHIGIIRFERDNDFNKLQPAMLEAYEQAKNIGLNAYFVNDDIVSSMSDVEWKQLITESIDNRTPEITLTSEAFNFADDEPQKVMTEAFTVVKDKLGNLLSIGTFFSMAQEFKLEEALDKVIVNNIIALMESQTVQVPVTINLSMTSVISTDFHNWLQARLENTSIASNLFAFSVTAYSVAKDVTAFANFCAFIKSIGATTLLKRYSSDIIPIDMLKELHLDYVRLARDLTTDIRGNTSKAEFLELIHEVTSLLDIKLLAEGVSDDNDLAILKATGIYGVSR